MEKNENPMRARGKNNNNKKNLEPVFAKFDAGEKINETLQQFLEKVMRATK